MYFTNTFKDLSGPALSLCSIENQLWAQALLAGVEKASLPVKTVKSSLAVGCVCVCVCTNLVQEVESSWVTGSLPSAPTHPRVGRTQGACRSGRGVTSSLRLHHPVCTDP